MGAQAPGAPGGVASHAVTADLRRALSALLRFDRGSATRGQPVAVDLTLQNTGAGHHVPTGNPHSALRIDVVLVDAAGKELAPAFSTTLARKVEDKAPWATLSDTRLAAGGQLHASHTFTPNAKGAAGWGAFEVRAVRDGTTTVLSRVPVEIR
jgi:hypothetical protein